MLRRRRGDDLPTDIDVEAGAIVRSCAPFTMTSTERLHAAVTAVRHVNAAGIAGALVECGTWKGGSAMAMALAQLEIGPSRDLWLYDTFAGMSEPTSRDVPATGGASAWERWASMHRGDRNEWCYASKAEVAHNISLAGYPDERTILVEGKVEDTIPGIAPAKIAVLRLDTDWYESTRHELEHLYPRLALGGVLIVDDYGHWQGARQAVDEFFHDAGPLLCRIDVTGRIAVKP